ncbi:Uncharacterized protein SCF082_LOCUS22241 [Durusdinium trenchii]|uniref:Uncharacterized protein n=1 Tax=Durusdinium trenchii TaxID=1381693 RepID=A0ABP0LG16_9DINO
MPICRLTLSGGWPEKRTTHSFIALRGFAFRMFRKLILTAIAVVALFSLLLWLASNPAVAMMVPLSMVLLAEDRIGLSKLARREGVSPVTAWRWSTRGLHGIVLETFCVGKKRMTTEQAWERFVERTTAKANGDPIPTRTAKQKERAIDAAEAELEKELAGA